LKKAVANKWLNGTTEPVGDIKRHHGEQISSFRFYSLFMIIVVLL